MDRDRDQCPKAHGGLEVLHSDLRRLNPKWPRCPICGITLRQDRIVEVIDLRSSSPPDDEPPRPRGTSIPYRSAGPDQRSATSGSASNVTREPAAGGLARSDKRLDTGGSTSDSPRESTAGSSAMSDQLATSGSTSSAPHPGHLMANRQRAPPHAFTQSLQTAMLERKESILCNPNHIKEKPITIRGKLRTYIAKFRYKQLLSIRSKAITQFVALGVTDFAAMEVNLRYLSHDKLINSLAGAYLRSLDTNNRCDQDPKNWRFISGVSPGAYPQPIHAPEITHSALSMIELVRALGLPEQRDPLFHLMLYKEDPDAEPTPKKKSERHQSKKIKAEHYTYNEDEWEDSDDQPLLAQIAAQAAVKQQVESEQSDSSPIKPQVKWINKGNGAAKIEDDSDKDLLSLKAMIKASIKSEQPSVKRERELSDPFPSSPIAPLHRSHTARPQTKTPEPEILRLETPRPEPEPEPEPEPKRSLPRQPQPDRSLPPQRKVSKRCQISVPFQTSTRRTNRLLPDSTDQQEIGQQGDRESSSHNNQIDEWAQDWMEQYDH